MAAMEEALLKRVLPHSIEAEQSVIGAMIMDRDAIVAASEIVVQEDFYSKPCGTLFEAMVELNDEGKPVDLITLQDRLKEKGCSAGSKQPGIYQRFDYSSSYFGKYKALCQYCGGKGHA